LGASEFNSNHSERFGSKLAIQCFQVKGWTTTWRTGQLCGETASDFHFPHTRGENSTPHIKVTEGSKAHHLPFNESDDMAFRNSHHLSLCRKRTELTGIYLSLEEWWNIQRIWVSIVHSLWFLCSSNLLLQRVTWYS